MAPVFLYTVRKCFMHNAKIFMGGGGHKYTTAA